MHELSIAMAVLETVAAAAARAGASRVLSIRLRVGELTTVDPAALQFAYAAATGDHPLFAGSQLQVEWVRVRIDCPTCGEGPALPRTVACAACGSPLTRVLAGEELDVDDVEVERHAKAAADSAKGAVEKR